MLKIPTNSTVFFPTARLLSATSPTSAVAVLGLLTVLGCSSGDDPDTDVGTQPITSGETPAPGSPVAPNPGAPDPVAPKPVTPAPPVNTSPDVSPTVAPVAPVTPVTPEPVAPMPVPSGSSGNTSDTTTSTNADSSSSTSGPSPDVSPSPLAPGERGLGAFTCPPPPYAETPVPQGVNAEKVGGVPPSDDFASSGDLVILEGPVWVNGTLYLSQINAGPPFSGFPGGGGGQPDPTDSPSGPQTPPSRVLALHGEGRVSVLAAQAGSNGLAVDASGQLLTANHQVGGITELSQSGGDQVTLVNQYAGVRFNSPNDITVGRDGTIYFTDPDYQAPMPAPQSETRAYRLPPGATEALPIVEGRRQPNGITLSPTGETLYISAQDGLVAYPVQSDGSLGQGQPFAQGVVSSSDGMAVDCAGNLYTTNGQSVIIVNDQGAEVGRINVSNVQSVTNVAFGGADSKTIYITSLGTGDRFGLYQVTGQIPGMPY